jgi:rhodanese-related sulfurtransferase
VTIIEQREQILRMLDWEMARLVERHLESHGVRVRPHTQVLRFEGDEGAVSAVVTDRGTIRAEMVIVGIGIRPEVGLARRAGLAIGDSGAIRVDAHLRTSDPDIYAAGDCTEQTHLLTGQSTYVPLGSTANKQGRVAAVNLCGGDDVFPGVLGSTICRVFEYCVARTGLTQREADEAGFDAVSVLTPAPDRAHYMPDARMLLIKLVADRASRKLLGVQAVGAGDGAKRIDVAAMALTAGMTVDQLAHADLCYAPPYSPAIDNLITAANVARNKLDGHMNGISPMAVKQMLDDECDLVLLDVRSPDEVQRHRLPGSTFIPLGALRGRLDELPRDKPIIAFCEISLRGYEAALILRAAGFADVRVMDGGLAMWPYDLAQ